VVLKFFQDLGGAHPSNWYKAFNFNLGTRQPLTFDNLFAPAARHWTYISRWCSATWNAKLVRYRHTTRPARLVHYQTSRSPTTS